MSSFEDRLRSYLAEADIVVGPDVVEVGRGANKKLYRRQVLEEYFKDDIPQPHPRQPPLELGLHFPESLQHPMTVEQGVWMLENGWTYSVKNLDGELTWIDTVEARRWVQAGHFAREAEVKRQGWGEGYKPLSLDIDDFTFELVEFGRLLEKKERWGKIVRGFDREYPPTWRTLRFIRDTQALLAQRKQQRARKQARNKRAAPSSDDEDSDYNPGPAPSGAHQQPKRRKMGNSNHDQGAGNTAQPTSQPQNRPRRNENHPPAPSPQESELETEDESLTEEIFDDDEDFQPEEDDAVWIHDTDSEGPGSEPDSIFSAEEQLPQNYQPSDEELRALKSPANIRPASQAQTTTTSPNISTGSVDIESINSGRHPQYGAKGPKALAMIQKDAEDHQNKLRAASAGTRNVFKPSTHAAVAKKSWICDWIEDAEEEDGGQPCSEIFDTKIEGQGHVLSYHVPEKRHLINGMFTCYLDSCNHTHNDSDVSKLSGRFDKNDKLKSHIRAIMDVREFACKFKPDCKHRANRKTDITQHQKGCRFNPDKVDKKKKNAKIPDQENDSDDNDL